jgi:NhaA family Na+:H+ antiporter
MTAGADPQPPVEPAGLPRELVDRFSRPFDRFLRLEAAGGAVLLLVTLGTVALVNSPWGAGYLRLWDTQVSVRVGSFALTHTLRSAINDGLMTLFFFLLALELKRELVLGELKNPRVAALSIAGALGGMIVPAGIYLALLSDRPGSAG